MIEKYGNIMKHGAWKASLGILLGVGFCFSQDFDVRGDGSNSSIILQGKNVNPSAADKIGVQGVSVPTGYYGIGVKGMGGYMGVYGQSLVSTPNTGVGNRFGLYGQADYGAYNYGTYTYATGTTGANYGVYAVASGVNSRAGYFAGDLEYTGALVHTSDRKLKKNIVDMKNSLAIINRLSPKEYDYRSDEFPAMHLPKGHQTGLVAQDVEEALPELVREATMPESPTDAKADPAGIAAPKKPETYKTVDYVALIPYLIGAIQEQSAEIERLKKRLGGG
ncbi:MAG: hypothetical protein JWO30_3119 [Fibrobacteres bacterium]|nr:hypothetical protein [Fibrobacterota bacterium]